MFLYQVDHLEEECMKMRVKLQIFHHLIIMSINNNNNRTNQEAVQHLIATWINLVNQVHKHQVVKYHLLMETFERTKFTENSVFLGTSDVRKKKNKFNLYRK